MKNIRLGVKLLGGFLLTAFIAAAIGLVGIYELNKMTGHIEEIGNVRLPSIESMMQTKESLTRLTQSMRTMMSPYISREIRERQYDNVEKAREKYHEAIDIYAPLPQTPEEAKLWDKFQPSVKKAADLNNQAVALSRELQETDILNPDHFLMYLQTFRGDHYALGTKVGELLLADIWFEGGTDPTACRFGKWMGTFSTTNPELAALVEQTREPHNHFHEAVAEIKTNYKSGNMFGAKNAFTEEMVPAAQEVFKSFDEMIVEAEQSQTIFSKMTQLLLGPARDQINEVFSLVDGIVDINRQVGREAVEEARSDASTGLTTALVGMLAGVVIAVFLGIVLTRGITGPVRKGVAFAEAMAKGDFTRELDVDQKDEVGVAGQVLERHGPTACARSWPRSSPPRRTLPRAARSCPPPAQSLSQGATEQAASVEEVSSSMEQMAANIRQNAENAAEETEKIALKSAEDAQDGGKAVSADRVAMKQHRRKDLHHRGDRPADQPPGPERGHRGGPGRRARQGASPSWPRRSASWPSVAGRRRRDQRAVGLQRGRWRRRPGNMLNDGPGHPEDRRAGSGDQRLLQRAELRRRPDQQGRAAARPGHPTERLGRRGDGLHLRGVVQPGRNASGVHVLLPDR